jgi:transposase InsO family protein
MILSGRIWPSDSGAVEVVDHPSMVIDMNESKVRTIKQVREFLQGTRDIEFLPHGDDVARYGHVGDVVRRLAYARLGRADRGQVLRYLGVTTGYASAQVKRLVARALSGQPLVKHYAAPAQAFARRYSSADIALLARVDREFGTLSGPATAHVLRRAFAVYADARFERLAELSPSHLYNLRASRTYERERVLRTKTRPSAKAIGTRKAPAPDGRAGFIRIDSVHQGDLDGVKGVYYINAVDCVTQWQVVVCCERISEAYLMPVLEQLLRSFPFRLRGFHSDNGSEYINARVAALLDKLRVEFTKSRPRRSNDNGLAETKNGAVVRKIFGYEHIAQRHAAPINTFCAEHLTPFLNLHRPCLFATLRPDPKKPGRVHKVYRPEDAMTPLEKLASLPKAKQGLRKGVSLKDLLAQAVAKTDLQAAHDLNVARQGLFESIRKRA